ncbi:MAG: hypothetical protein DIZ77_08055 [endosymbiont of Seepiophila jonesi]|uniref:Uncharacterized protein n=1 Tax=endosymbiont of Lamellibrachia luymesi TaxID=2200907 RepID=A0A370DZ70_9GAMM|nr:MAG: hypothetical protein DIZ79_05080 [endosymbiont of Lamellibrachia luymesi]RDH92589.1 MAG: hypothetical protein DIZ77_08055 [endosymbiont of Seepiophila jonesi]
MISAHTVITACFGAHGAPYKILILFIEGALIMPVEIRELVIRAEVGGQEQRRKGSSSGTRPAPEDKEALIAECIERIMQILQEREER